MKSNILCDASHCMHNREGLCDASVVHVRDGRESARSARCTTYAYRVSGAGSRLLMEMGEDMSLDRTDKNESIPIACGKFDCLHNDDCACRAGEIRILSPEMREDRECACETYCPTS